MWAPPSESAETRVEREINRFWRTFIATPVENLSPYLLDAPNIWAVAQRNPLCNAPSMTNGSKPADGGHLHCTPEEAEKIRQADPIAAKYLRRLVGADELIKGKERYCFWLVDADLEDMHRSPELRRRIQAVRETRLQSKNDQARKFADIPHLFEARRQPSSDYLIMPRVTSENRFYIPMQYANPEIIVNDRVQVIPNCGLEHFAVLTSRVHMAWMRITAGRLETRYSYSATVVYNTFIWPELNDSTREALRASARKILDARAEHPKASLAALYSETTMPATLRRAHETNDKLVAQLYGYAEDLSEEEIVIDLLKRYRAKMEENLRSKIGEKSKAKRKKNYGIKL